MSETWQQAVELAMSGAPPEARAAWRRLVEREAEILQGVPERIRVAEAAAEALRVKCETAYREGYAAAMARLGEEAKLDAARADGLRARILSPSCLAGPAWAAADADRAALRPAPVLASNPLDTRTPDYHQLAEDLFAAVREMLRQKERADRAEQGAREADAARRIVEFSDARIRGERDTAEAEAKAQKERADLAQSGAEAALALSRRDNTRALEAEHEVESLTARLEQMRGRAEEAAATVREQLAGMRNDVLEAAALVAEADLGVVPPGPFAPSGLVAAENRLDGEASHNTAWRIIIAIRDLKTPVDG